MRIDHHVEVLSRLLDLTDQQKAAVTDVLDGTLPKREAVLIALRDDEISLEDALGDLMTLKDESIAAIRDILIEKQINRLEALKPLRMRFARW
ncbi:MAG: hypothetical protein GTO29_13365 [Candidatus Latescibacteria bacterium]|nr:hypothetical protein [Candidatus Latescibacterota bacterium]NIO57240.1 hypothetical protein [Candidatus Latescibacterota bacterium]